jgi:hypothetical protein
LINRLNPRWMISALMFCEINKFERFESVTPVRSAFGPPLCRGFPRHSVLDYPSFWLEMTINARSEWKRVLRAQRSGNVRGKTWALVPASNFALNKAA